MWHGLWPGPTVSSGFSETLELQDVKDPQKRQDKTEAIHSMLWLYSFMYEKQKQKLKTLKKSDSLESLKCFFKPKLIGELSPKEFDLKPESPKQLCLCVDAEQS
jgi:hypothetical protein